MLTLQSASIGGGADFTAVTLTGGTIVSGSSSQLEVRVLTQDLNRIKTSAFLCTRRTDCYIRFSGSFGRDAFNNPLPALANSITPRSTDYPLIYVPDTTGPIVESFNLDLENALLEILFNELIVASTFDVTELSFQDAPVPTTSYSLTGIQTGSRLQFPRTALAGYGTKLPSCSNNCLNHCSLVTTRTHNMVVYCQLLQRFFLHHKLLSRW